MSELQFIQQHPVTIYRYAISRGARNAVLFGLLGGAGAGVIGWFPAKILLRRIISPSVTEADVWGIVLGEVVLALVGLLITMITLSLRVKGPSRRSNCLMGAGTGAVFALTVHLTLLGGVTGVLSNRSQYAFPFSNQDTLGLALAHSVYPTIVEGYAMALGSIFVLTLFGAVLGSLLLPIDAAPASLLASSTRDAFGAFSTLLLPALCYALITVNVVILALLEPSLQKQFAKVGERYDPAIPLAVTAMIIPLLAQLLAQVLAIVWIWRSDVLTLHRGMLSFTQVVYGLGATVGQIIVSYKINPGLFLTFPGLIYTAASVLLAIIFVAIAERQLRLGQQRQVPARLNMGLWQVWSAGATTLLLCILVAAFLSGQIIYNLGAINVGFMALSLPNSDSTLDSILTNALVQPGIWALIVFIGVIVLTFIPLALLSWFTSRMELREVSAQTP